MSACARSLAAMPRATPIIVLLMLLAGCRPQAPAAIQQEELSGTVTYRERVVLPADARLELGLLDARGVTVADTSLATGREPPIPFRMQIPAARIDTAAAYYLTARLDAGRGRQVWSTPEPVPVLTRGAPREVELVLTAERRPEAPLAEPWRHARERGVAFRAVGPEPGWVLDLYGRFLEPRRLVLRLDYGETWLQFDEVLRDEDGDGNLRFRASSDTLRLEAVIEDRLCYDVMSGERFEAVVSIRINERQLAGCGRGLH